MVVIDKSLKREKGATVVRFTAGDQRSRWYKQLRAVFG